MGRIMNTAKCVEPISPSGNKESRFSRNRPKALELFAERGFAQVSLRELASHLEISTGSLYTHYSSKEELLLEFIEEHYMALLSLFDRRHRRDSPKATLLLVIQGVDSLHETHPWHFRLATRDVGCLKPNQQRYISRFRQQLRQQLTSLLCSAGFLAQEHRGIPIVELFEHLPIWLAGYPLDKRQRCSTLMRLLTSDYPPAETRQ